MLSCKCKYYVLKIRDIYISALCGAFEGGRFNPHYTIPPAAPVSDAGLPPGEAVASGQTPLPSDLEAWLNEQERQVLIRALNETGFNRTAAAARLGLNLRQIRYRMARLGIVPPGSHAEESGNDGDDGEAA